MLRNFRPRASSINPSTTFTEFSHPPDLGMLLSQRGKKANRVNGNAKARENPSMPMMGSSTCPLADATRIAPTMGPVQENETSTRVNAIKKEPTIPPRSACESDLLISQLGRVISNIPRNEAAKNIKIRKNRILGSQWVLRKLAKLAPSVMATTVPMTV